eukprot:gene7233-11548_t
MTFFFDVGVVVVTVVIVYVTNCFTQPFEELTNFQHWKLKFGLENEKPFTFSKTNKSRSNLNDENKEKKETKKLEEENKETNFSKAEKKEEIHQEPKIVEGTSKEVPIQENEEKIDLSIPKKLHQYCIGKAGAVVKEISTASNCKLNFDEDNVEIKGTKEDRNKAVELIMNTLSEVGWFFENNEWVERTKQDELWKKYRGEAQKEVELRNECYEKSKKVFEEGDKELAKKLSEEGKEHDEKWKVLTKEAGKNIFNEMNQNNDKNIIDLHGLFVDEAIEFVKERLNELKGNDITLSIITGAGNHSSAGALIKPKIHELLKQEGFTFTEEKNGQVDVVIA